MTSLKFKVTFLKVRRLSLFWTFLKTFRFVRIRLIQYQFSPNSKELVRSDGWSCPSKCYQESVTWSTLAPTGVLSGMFVKYLCLSNFGGESLRSCTLMRTLSVPVRAGSPPSVATICTGSMTLSLCLRSKCHYINLIRLEPAHMYLSLRKKPGQLWLLSSAAILESGAHLRWSSSWY